MAVDNNTNSAVVQLLGLDVNGPDSLNRLITIRNRSDESVEVDWWLEPLAPHAKAVDQWVTADKSSMLTLRPQSTETVKLSFSVPRRIPQGEYPYAVCVQEANRLASRVTRKQVLKVLSSEQRRSHREPTVTVTPETTSYQPYLLSAANAQDRPTFELTFVVENHSRQIERVSLVDVDLPESWYSVEYGALGFQNEPDLKLSSGEEGEIRLKIQPPLFAPAGNYSPTVELRSSLCPDALLLKVVYFTIEAAAELGLALWPEVRSLPNQNPDPAIDSGFESASESAFELTVTNTGNVSRHLWLQAADVEGVLSYVLSDPNVFLAPGEGAVIDLWPQPKRWWHRLWRFKRREVSFEVLAGDLVAGGQIERAIAPPINGKVLYLAQRRWLFFLLLGLLLLSGLGLFGWWLRRASSVPKISSFTPTAESFQENEALSFQWEITNPEHVELITLTQQGTEVESRYLLEESEEEGFFLAYQSPDGESDDEQEKIKCSLSETVASSNIVERIQDFMHDKKQPLICPAVPILHKKNGDTKKSEHSISDEGKYAFKMQIFEPEDDKDTAPDDEGEPTSKEAGEAEPDSQKDEGSKAEDAGAEAQEVEAQEVEAQEAEAEKAKDSESKIKMLDQSVVKDLVITPAIVPAIVDFRSVASEYRVGEQDESSAAVSGSMLSAPVLLNFTVENALSVEGIQLSSRMTDTQEIQNSSLYEKTDIIQPEVEDKNGNEEISQPDRVQATDDQANTRDAAETGVSAGMPLSLRQFCSEVNNSIVCENVPMPVPKVGSYVFSLRVSDFHKKAVQKQTPVIYIRPLPPVIESFMVNSQEALEKPHHVLSLNPIIQERQIPISWEVSDSTSRIELLPAPGVITEGSISYTLSAAPGSEVITLRATNVSGEQVTQSVVIEKVEYVPESTTPLVAAPGQLPILPVPVESDDIADPAPPQYAPYQPSPTIVPPQAD